MTAQYSYPPIHQQNGYNQYSGMGYHDHFSATKAAGPAVNGLTFRKRQERIDWRKIASVDVDQIARMMDFNALQENITNITFCNIDAELDLRSVDPNFTKLFKLAQLTIEYLLHSQDYLAGVVSSAEEKFKSMKQENEKMTERLEKQQKEMAEIKKESHKRKKMLTAQQQLLQAGSGSYNKCPYCSKAFVNSSFLQAHLQRRHGDNVTPSQSPQSPARLNTVLEKELVEIKERLKTTESLLQSERSKSRRELFSEKNVTNILREENKENHSDTVRVKEKQDLTEDQMNELERMKNLLMVELKEMNEKYQASQNALIEMERQYGKRSHLGELRDDLDDEAELLRRQREEVAMLKEQLRQQKSKMSSGVDSQMKKQERKWEKRMQKMSADHANELAKMNTALERSVKALEKSQNQVQKQGAATKETTAKERMINQESSRQVAKEVSKPVKTETQRKAVSHGSGASPAGGKTPAKSTDHPKRPQKTSSIDPFPDTDSEDEEELLSVGHTAGTTGEFSTQRSGRLMEQLRHDPTILKGMREELEEILAEKMEKMGVPRRSKGMSSEMLASKLSVLKTERKALDQRFPGFDDVRLRLRRHVDETAKERFKQLRRSPPSSGNRTATNSTFGSSPSVNVHQGGHTVSSASRPAPEIRKPVNNPVPVPKTRPSAVNQRSPPRPTQRSTSPIRNGNAAPLQSTGSTTEWTSTNWDSDEDEESEDGEIDTGRFGFPQSSRPVPRPRNNTPSPRNAPSPSPRTPKVQSRVTDSVSDWESDGISDLEELDLRPNPSRPSTSQTKPPPSQPRGQKVAELSQSIEFQLGTRKGKKPTGSVDTMGRSQQRSPDLQGFKDDDSFPDISSLDENDGVAPIQRPQKHGVGRSSFADTDQSSNTLGTSKWGSSSRGASPGGHVSGKDSVVSLTDWDSDISDL